MRRNAFLASFLNVVARMLLISFMISFFGPPFFYFGVVAVCGSCRMCPSRAPGPAEALGEVQILTYRVESHPGSRRRE